MTAEIVFTVNEIKGMSLSISIPNQKNVIDIVAQSLHKETFQTTKSFKADFTDLVDRMFSHITFAGKGFSFGLSKTKFSAQFLQELDLLQPNMDIDKEDPAKLFTDENLAQISSDFNHILGLINSLVNLDKKFNFNIHMVKEIPAIHHLNYMLSPSSNIIFGDVTELKLNGIYVCMNETLFGTQVKSTYQIGQNESETKDKNFCVVDAEFEFEHAGPIQFSKLVNESTNRLNSLITNVLRGTNESK